MPQLHLYVPDDVAAALRTRAQAEGKTLSQYLAAIARKEVERGWPAGYFESLVGPWSGEKLVRPEALPEVNREAIT